jgi:hypothetical protein
MVGVARAVSRRRPSSATVARALTVDAPNSNRTFQFWKYFFSLKNIWTLWLYVASVISAVCLIVLYLTTFTCEFFFANGECSVFLIRHNCLPESYTMWSIKEMVVTVWKKLGIFPMEICAFGGTCYWWNSIVLMTWLNSLLTICNTLILIWYKLCE